MMWMERTRLMVEKGPIIRINPNEVHVNDPELLDAVYPGGWKKVNKDPYVMSQFGYVCSTLLALIPD